MMRIEFMVSGNVPPKKDGANAMWGKKTEVPRLLALRLSAHKALQNRAPLSGCTSMEIEIHVPKNDRATGDLDNFIAGVCDGLQAAHKNTRWQHRLGWENVRRKEVLPDRTIAIKDDSDVLEIVGRKIVGDCTQPWYRVVLCGDVAQHR